VPFIVIKLKQQVEQKWSAVILECFVIKEHFTKQAKIFTGDPVVVSIKLENANVRIKVDLISRNHAGALSSMSI